MAQLKDLIVSGATRILGKTYSPEFIGKLTGNADTATKATGDSNGQNIVSTYIKNLSIDGKTLNIYKGNGSNSSLTIKDKIYAGNRITTVDDLNKFIEQGTFKYGIINPLEGLNGLEKNDGIILSFSWDNSTAWGHQIFLDDSSYNMAHRHLSNGTWQAWVKMIDANNYTNYTVTKTGSGASGTWGINVTGNSGTATKLQTARTISLTGSVTGSGSFDGSGNLTISTTTNHYHNQYYDSGISRAANTVLAAPNGSAGSAIFRKLVAADLPDSYLPLSGGTMSGTINFAVNKLAMNFRNDTASYYTGIMYQTTGNEALVFAARNAVTSFMFKCGLDPTAMTSSTWTTTTPSVQIKGQSLYINSLIANGAAPSYNFYVNGTSYLTDRLIATANIYSNRGSTSAPSFMWNKAGTYFGGIGYHGVSGENYLGPVNGDGTWADSSGDTWYIRGRLKSEAIGSSDDTYIAFPSGGGYKTKTSVNTGYLKITLPQTWTNTMLSFRIKIYEYRTNTSCDYFISGYNYSSNSSWINVTAYSTGKNDTKTISNLNVRFGHDGSKCAIYIGESNTSWNYTQVRVCDVLTGFNNCEYSKWATGWEISFTTTLGTISQTVTNPNVSRINTVYDINDGDATTFAYSKTGLDYNAYTWLAAWNGKELRAVNKSQFATAGHTHNYAGSSSAGGPANSTNAIAIVANNEIRFIKPSAALGGNALYIGYAWADGTKSKMINEYRFCGGDGNLTQITATQFNGFLNGNASTASSATKLSTSRTISLAGTVVGSGSFDGSANLSISTSVKDVNNSNTVTFAYSKAGVGYNDITWLAAWNGYELRAINKNQFAKASASGNALYADDSDKLDGYHRKGLYSSIPDWINANGYTKTITVNGNANTYYPVIIGLPLSKEGFHYVSIWKNLGSKTASYSGNHSNGTSSMWIIYEGRNMYWDGNGGYVKCWYYSMPYATLCAQTDLIGDEVGSICIYLRGGGTDYYISTTYDCTPKVYYSTTNIGTSNYPKNVAPRTNIGNYGRISNAILGYGNIEGIATAATSLTSSAGSSTSPIYFSGGKPVTCGSTLSVSITGNAATATALASSAGSTGQPIYFNSGKPAAIDWHIGNSSTGEHNANNITYNMTGYYTSGGPSDLGNSTTDGAIYAQAYSSTWVAQMAQDYRNGNLFLRGKNNGTWQGWKAVLTSDYKPICFHWKGQDGQPVWLWGGTEPGTDMYVYNPSNFNVKYASSSGNADMVDGYHASSLWRSDGATWNPNANVSLNASDNSQEWSFDIRRNGKTGCYWHVWDSSYGSLLKVTADDGKVSAPYNFVGKLEGTTKTLAAGGNLDFPMTFNWSGQGGQPTWLWGGNDYSNIYVYNPSNFNVASSNKLNMQYNVVTSIANDTTSNWANMGCMCSFNTQPNQLNGQPSQYGLIFSMGTPIDVHQIWMTQANGSIYHRGGNSAGWNGSWSRFLTANEDFYRPGSSFTVHLTCGGFCTEYAKNLYFTIPLDMPTSGVNGVSIRSSQGLIIRQNNKYLYGSGVSKYIYPSSYNARLSHGVIWVYATFGNSTNATNNSACGCTVDVVVTFS